MVYFLLQGITPHVIQKAMSVVKKDIVIHGMLEDEMERCERMSASLESAIAELPKGSLHQREMRNKKNVHKS